MINFTILFKNNLYRKKIGIFSFVWYKNLNMERKQPCSDMNKFRKIFLESKHIVVLTGAGISAESGVPTFRGSGGLWRTWRAQDLATPSAFKDPSLVWEFYHYRREVMLSKFPNLAHTAVAQCQERFEKEGKKLTVITQNIDELHQRAGTESVIELHGSLFKTRCTKCSEITENYDSPICPSLKDKGAPDPSAKEARIPLEELPRCNKCSGLLRPHVVWFGEGLDPMVLDRVDKELDLCDLCLVVGTSAVVYPAAMFAPQVASRGVPVAEFNIDTTPSTDDFAFHFEGPCGKLLPEALAT